MAKGTVKWYNDAKGFGFITPEDGTQDVFLHHSGIKDKAARINEGSRVSYEVKNGPKGLEAINVEVVDY